MTAADDSMATGQVPKQERAVRTRERIFDAAQEVFAEKGFAGASVVEIADRAGVNKERIYAYFGSKGALYRRVLISVYASVAEHEGLLSLTSADVPDLTSRIVDRFFEIHENNPRFWRLLCWENLNGGRSLTDADWDQIRRSYIVHLEGLYRRGQARGLFRGDIDFTTYLLVLFSTTYFYFSNQMTISHLLGVALDSTTMRRHIENQFVDMMSRGMSPLSSCGDEG